jgi:F0F1-type ATP synthase assembly protein I
MIERSESREEPDQEAAAPRNLSEHDAWGMVSTLVAGPVTWGLIGAGIDLVVGTHRVFLPIGVVLGFVVAFYITYFRYGRS